MSDLTNHLWQSTIFAVAVALTAMALRRNSAGLRYWLWLAASVKFLIPISLLVSMGGRIAMPPDAPDSPALTVLRVSTYFSPASAFSQSTPVVGRSHWLVVLRAIWLAGSVMLLLSWFRRWRTIHKQARNARLLPMREPLPVLSSAATIEPGIFGLLRPVLPLPEGIVDNLTAEQFEAVFAHELCHARYRDNFTAALHMCVATIFWFHPLVCRGSIPVSLLRKLTLVAALAMVSIPFAIGIVRAQSLPPEPAYTYEVVSIHPSKPGQGRTYFRGGTAGGYRTDDSTAMQLLTWAYQVHDYQIAGAPGWVTANRFDVSFTPDRTEISPRPGIRMSEVDAWTDRNRQRMQAVLRDRFGLVLRAETHQLPIYALVLAKGGHKLSPPSAGKPGPYFGVSRGVSGPLLTASNATIKMLTEFLSRQLDRFVIDDTGLNGEYDFKLEWTPDSSLQAPPNEQAIATGGPSIFTALSEQLGLRLVSRKGAVPVYVIEKIEKPGEN